MAQQIKITLPKGIARYPSLHQADTKFHDAGIWKSNIAVPAEVAEPFMKRLQAIAKEELGKALPKSDNSLWKYETDDNGDENGLVQFKCTTKNIIKKDGSIWDRKPQQLDTQLNQVNEVIFGGSELAVACYVRIWEFSGKKGISLQPYSVQIHKLVGPANGDNEDHGFDAQDEGYVSTSDSSAFAPVATEASSDDDDEEDDVDDGYDF
jgi:hypothetical protein